MNSCLDNNDQLKKKFLGAKNRLMLWLPQFQSCFLTLLKICQSGFLKSKYGSHYIPPTTKTCFGTCDDILLDHYSTLFETIGGYMNNCNRVTSPANAPHLAFTVTQR